MSLLIDRKFRSARQWSNMELRKFSKNLKVLEWNQFDASQPADNLRNLYKIVYRPNGAAS